MGLSQKLSWETWECHAFFNKKSPEHPVKNIPVYKITQLFCMYIRKLRHKWNKVFKDGPSKICRRQPLKNLKAVLHKFHLAILEYFVPNIPQGLIFKFSVLRVPNSCFPSYS